MELRITKIREGGVDDLIKSLGFNSVSKSQVSRIYARPAAGPTR